MRLVALVLILAACGDNQPGFGDPCTQQHNAWATSCEIEHEAGWCVVTDVGEEPTCQRQCDTLPCPKGEEPVPVVGDHCYCR